MCACLVVVVLLVVVVIVDCEWVRQVAKSHVNSTEDNITVA